MHAQVGFVHRRDRMARHRRVTVEPVARAIDGGEQVAKRLIALQARRADDHRRPFARHVLHAEVDRTADRTHLRRRIERRAHLVLQDRRTQRGETRESAGQCVVHPLRAASARRTREPDAAHLRKARQQFRRRGVETQQRRHAGGGHRFHRVGRAGEIVAVIGEQHAGGPVVRGCCAHFQNSNAAFNATLRSACRSSGTPSIAATHASRNASTPAATPPG